MALFFLNPPLHESNWMELVCWRGVTVVATCSRWPGAGCFDDNGATAGLLTTFSVRVCQKKLTSLSAMNRVSSYCLEYSIHRNQGRDSWRKEKLLLSNQIGFLMHTVTSGPLISSFALFWEECPLDPNLLMMVWPCWILEQLSKDTFLVKSVNLNCICYWIRLLELCVRHSSSSGL